MTFLFKHLKSSLFNWRHQFLFKYFFDEHFLEIFFISTICTVFLVIGELCQFGSFKIFLLHKTQHNWKKFKNHKNFFFHFFFLGGGRNEHKSICTHKSPKRWNIRNLKKLLINKYLYLLFYNIFSVQKICWIVPNNK